MSYLEGEAVVVVRVSEVAVVDEPHVSVVEDLVVLAGEELLEVLRWLKQISQPDHGREVCSTALQEFASQLHLVSLLLVGCLYKLYGLDYKRSNIHDFSGWGFQGRLTGGDKAEGILGETRTLEEGRSLLANLRKHLYICL